MEEIKKRIGLIKQRLNLPEIQRQIKEIEMQSADPDFWRDRGKASQKMKELGELQKEIEELEKLVVEGKLDG